MARLLVRGWADLQHYKDRFPPWIKLHKKLLDNLDFHRLPLASRALAPMLWLLASESKEGAIDFDLDAIAFRLRRSAAEVEDALKPLIEREFFTVDGVDASDPLAPRLPVAVPETEAETKKRRGDTPPPPAAPRPSVAPRPAAPKVPPPPRPPADPPAEPPMSIADLIAEGIDKQHATDWMKVRQVKKAPLTRTAWEGVLAQAKEAGITPARAVQYSAENNWQGFKAKWLANAETVHGAAGRAGVSPPVTVPSNAADRTRAELDERHKPLTAEQKAAADEARKRLITGLRVGAKAEGAAP